MAIGLQRLLGRNMADPILHYAKGGKLNIVHLVESLDIGGLERVVVSLAGIQYRSGHVVTVVCLFHAGSLAKELEALGISVVQCGKSNGFDWSAVRTIRGALNQSAADVLHTHNPVPHYYGVLAALGLGIKCILNTRHGMGMFPFSRKREFLFKIAMAASHYGVSVCKAAQANFVQLGIIPPQKARCVPNGIELAAFASRNQEAKSQLLLALDRSNDPIVFGTVGRLNPAKDHVSLLEAMALLVEQRSDVHLLIAGDGECRAELEQAVTRLGLTHYVTFLGRREDVPFLLRAFDIFVLSSRTEGYSLALVEAAATALPVIATDVGGNSEIVSHGVTGLVVAKESPRELCDAMMKLASDVSLRSSMGMAGQTWAGNFGSLDAMATAYSGLYSHERSRLSHRQSPA